MTTKKLIVVLVGSFVYFAQRSDMCFASHVYLFCANEHVSSGLFTPSLRREKCLYKVQIVVSRPNLGRIK